MNNKPDITDSEWALNDVVDLVTGVNNKVEPVTVKKNNGWDRLEKPPREYDNYLKNQYYLWLSFMNQFFEVFYGQTTGATEEELFVNGVTNNRLIINDDTSLTFEVLVNAFSSDSLFNKCWKIKGVIIRETNPYISIQLKEIINQNNWDITNFDTVAIGDSGAVTEAQPRCIFFKPDGTRMFLVGQTDDKIYQYPLSTAWDITTIRPTNGNSGVIAEEGQATSIFFSSDGKKVFLIGAVNDTVYQYPLSTAWDITTIGATSGNSGTLTEDSIPRSIFFKPDGTKMFLLGQNTDKIYQYPLSTAWDITTIGATSGNSGVIAEEGTGESIFFSSDGKKIYLIGSATDTIYEYPLSTAWDITTIGATSGNSGSLSSDEPLPQCVRFSPDGSHAYVIGDTNDTVHQYSIPLLWDINFEADIANNALIPKVTGQSGKTINWKIKLKKLENSV